MFFPYLAYFQSDLLVHIECWLTSCDVSVILLTEGDILFSHNATTFKQIEALSAA